MAEMNKASKIDWCRKHGVYPADLNKWRVNCTTALVDIRQPACHTYRPQTHQGTSEQALGYSRSSSPADAVKKIFGNPQQRRERMIGLQDRQAMGEDIKAAWVAGSWLQSACEIAGLKLNIPAVLEHSGMPHGGRWSACVCQSFLECGRAQGAAGDDQRVALFLYVTGMYCYAARPRERAFVQRVHYGACCAQDYRIVHLPRTRQGSRGQASAHRPHVFPCKRRHNAVAASLLRTSRYFTQCSVQSFEALQIARSILTPAYGHSCYATGVRSRSAGTTYSLSPSARVPSGALVEQHPKLVAINAVVFLPKREQRAIWLPVFNLFSTNICVPDDKPLHTAVPKPSKFEWLRSSSENFSK